MRHNLKAAKEFKVGGWARSRAWGSRVYRVLNMFYALRQNHKGEVVNELYVTLQKTFETNRGKPIFYNSRPFTVRENETLENYYPAVAVKTPFSVS